MSKRSHCVGRSCSTSARSRKGSRSTWPRASSRAFENFAIDAGGDLYLGGCNAAGEPWSVGIRHPRDEHQLIDTMRVSNTAVCTSGDYERRVAGDSPSLDRDADHHIIDARTGLSATTAASVTVVAPLAIVADGLATAAFVLGPGARHRAARATRSERNDRDAVARALRDS